jgi:hypothetical protein
LITSTPGYFHLANAGKLVSIATAMAARMRCWPEAGMTLAS